MKPKYLFAKDPWRLAEDIPDSDIFFFQIPMSCFCSDTSYPFLKNYKRVLTHYKKFRMNFYFSERDSFEVGESILKALLKKPKLGRDINRNIVKWSKKLIEFARATVKLPLKIFTNEQLWQIYDEHDQIHTKLYTYGWLPVALDMFHNNLTKKLKSYLYAISESKTEAESAFVQLTAPLKKSILAKEREEFLSIYKKYAKALEGPSAELLKVLKNHSERWGHLGYIYAGNVKPFGAAHYLKELRDLKKTKFKIAATTRKEAVLLRQAKLNRIRLFRQLKINRQYQQLFSDAGDFALTKLVRRHAQLLALYLMHRSLLAEIARRLELTRYQAQFMLKDEVKEALLTGALNKSVLNVRLKECALYTEKNFEKVYTGSQMRKIIKGTKKLIDYNKQELIGQTAQSGYAKGAVKIIIRAKDMKKMKPGDILVSIATDPDIVPAMKKAAAIVTEQGGITSHAAIVSRELGIPCVIGTKIATKVFKDGDYVEVDAIRGVVKRIKK